MSLELYNNSLLKNLDVAEEDDDEAGGGGGGGGVGKGESSLAQIATLPYFNLQNLQSLSLIDCDGVTGLSLNGGMMLTLVSWRASEANDMLRASRSFY